MPTGYTDSIKNDITFKEFVMKCARAMGACISMRDISESVPIPEKFEVSTYHLDRLQETEERLKNIKSMTIEEANKKARERYNKEIDYKEKTIKDKLSLLEKYKNMLTKVNRWKPPTEDHIEFKKFMIDQLEKSINWDCDIGYTLKEKVNRLTGQEYIDLEIEGCLDDLKYHKKEYIEEKERVESRNNWIKQLRDSLKGEI